MKHGTEYAYKKGCRCDTCRSEQSKRYHRRTMRTLVNIHTNPEDFEHGTISTYRKGCRCKECRDAQRKKNGTYKQTENKTDDVVIIEEQTTTPTYQSIEEIERRRVSNDRWRERARLEAGLA